LWPSWQHRTALSAVTFAAVFGLGVVASHAQDAPADKSKLETLQERVRAVLEAPGFRSGHWGIFVVDATTGRTVFEHNSEQFFAPASVSKLFSVAAAMVELGADHRFETPVVRKGEVDPQGTLHGDLILVAQGDLSMGGRTGADGTLLFKDDDHTYAGRNLGSDNVGDPLAGLDHLAREVRAAGIKRVTGEVIIDDRLFEPAESTGSGPRRLSPILINDNVLDVIVEAGKGAGEPAAVSYVPKTCHVVMDAQVETVAPGPPSGTTSTSSQRIGSEKMPDAGPEPLPDVHIIKTGPHGFAVRGKIPVGHSRLLLSHDVDDPASLARAYFIEALRRREVRIDASPLGENDTSGLAAQSAVARLPEVAVYTSAPFRESIKVILKVSHNLHASTLPMLLAARHGERTLQAGLRRQGKILQSLGLDLATVSFGSGAGGSRSDLVTPRATVALLQAMAKRPDFAAFDAALPVLGRDGTLARAVAPDSPVRGHAHARTGTHFVENVLSGKVLLGSKALAGYLETASGRPLVFAFFVNNVMLDAPRPDRSVSEATAEAGRLLGSLCEVFYTSDSEEDATKPLGRVSSSAER
jgi:D-alanyl-D-alanine carboxypeptidase/D-alanyl-D-alanine-endopeptidase (penicillin-binding protein 4)